jgi:hypothetical protein
MGRLQWSAKCAARKSTNNSKLDYLVIILGEDALDFAQLR